MKPSMLYDYCKTQKFITILLSIASKLEIFKGPNWILYAALCNQMLVQAFGKLRICILANLFLIVIDTLDQISIECL